MTVATWQAAHAYGIGDLVNPTTANGHTYIAVTAGTSGNSEPTWTGRWPAVADGATATWAPYSIVTPATIRAMLKVGTELTSTQLAASQYSDTIIGNDLLDAISSLEQATKRYLVNHPGATIQMTSQGRATLPIPGLRTATSVTYQGATIASTGYWLLEDAMHSGVYTSIQFRPFRVPDGPGIPGTPYGPWVVYGNPSWFDLAADSPFYPGNYGGGYVYTSMPNDTILVGDWGYEPTFEPGDLYHAVEVLGAWYVMRPPAILADSAITPQGGVVSYSQMPPEVQGFVSKWMSGQQAVSIG